MDDDREHANGKRLAALSEDLSSSTNMETAQDVCRKLWQRWAIGEGQLQQIWLMLHSSGMRGVEDSQIISIGYINSTSLF